MDVKRWMTGALMQCALAAASAQGLHFVSLPGTSQGCDASARTCPVVVRVKSQGPLCTAGVDIEEVAAYKGTVVVWSLVKDADDPARYEYRSQGIEFLPHGPGQPNPEDPLLRFETKTVGSTTASWTTRELSAGADRSFKFSYQPMVRRVRPGPSVNCRPIDPKIINLG